MYSKETVDSAVQKGREGYYHPVPRNTVALHVEEYLLDGERATWRQAEEWICERRGWEDVDVATHDAVTRDDETIEIKSCVWRQQSGQPGRITVWDGQYRGADRLAVVVIADLDDSASILAQTIVDMDDVRPNMSYQWHSTMGYAAYHSYGWTELVTPADVRDGLRRELVEECQLTDTRYQRYDWWDGALAELSGVQQRESMG
jgi:hypothetical protein